MSTKGLENVGYDRDDNAMGKDSHDDGRKASHDNEKNLDEAVPAPATEALPVDEFPDGGLRAWLVVFGAMCTTFTAFGYVNSWAVFQSYYQQTILSTSSPSTISWIGSIQYSLVFLPGLVAGRLFDLGYDRSLMLASSILLVCASFLVAECKVYWQFLLCQGIAVGLACGGLTNPMMAVVAHWFKKKRGFAFGMVAVGSSVGGTVVPIAARNLFVRVGFPWTMRTIGFIQIFTLTLVNLTLRRRLPPKRVTGGLFNWAAFKSAPFTVYCASTFINFLGIYTVLTYIDIDASSLGIDPNLAFYLVSVANAASGVGRFVAGKLADPFGSMNIMIPLTGLAGIMTYAWPFAKTQGTLIAVTVLYGFFSGSYIALLANPIMEFGETADIGRRIGMMFSILSFGALIGPPISGAINNATNGYDAVGYYAGSAVLAGVCLMCIARHLVLGKLVGKL